MVRLGFGGLARETSVVGVGGSRRHCALGEWTWLVMSVGSGGERRLSLMTGLAEEEVWVLRFRN